MKRLTLASYAKVNLYLAVIGTLPRGYHEIVTIFERIDLCDTLTFIARTDRKIVVHCDDAAVPLDSANLCYRSARLLARTGVRRGADIVISKRIPVGAGLGGGSSNAAAALEGLNRLWGCGFSRHQLVEMGGRVGADVAFFLYDTPFALGTHRGEIITPLEAPRNLKLIHVLVVPRIHVATARIYGAWDTAHRRSRRAPSGGLTKKSADDRLVTHNDLEPLTIELYPEVGRVKRALRERGVSPVLMSGSGPAVFGLCASLGQARTLRDEIASYRDSWRSYVVRTK